MDQKHKFVIPGKFEHASTKSSEQKKQILLQLARYDIDGEAILTWDELLIPQIWDLGMEFGASFRKTDDIEKIKGKILKSAKFTENFGKSAKMAKVKFLYHVDNPYIVKKVVLQSEEEFSENSFEDAVETQDETQGKDSEYKKDRNTRGVSSTPKEGTSKKNERNVDIEITEKEIGVSKGDNVNDGENINTRDSMKRYVVAVKNL